MNTSRKEPCKKSEDRKVILALLWVAGMLNTFKWGYRIGGKDPDAAKQFISGPSDLYTDQGFCIRGRNIDGDVDCMSAPDPDIEV